MTSTVDLTGSAVEARQRIEAFFAEYLNDAEHSPAQRTCPAEPSTTRGCGGCRGCVSSGAAAAQPS